VSLSGLQAGTQYSVFIDTQAVPNESASAILNGPWTPLGMFDASSDGMGTYTCTQRPPSGSILAINPQPQDESILFSVVILPAFLSKNVWRPVSVGLA